MDATIPDISLPARRANPLIGRDFALLWAGQAVSGLGDMIFNTTVALWIVTRLAVDQSWAPVAVSAVLVIASVPDLLVGPLAGVFVDRLDRRRLMMRMDLIRAALVGLLVVWSNAIALPFSPFAHLSTPGKLAGIYVTIFLAGVASQFFAPARLAIIGELVPEQERARAAGLTQMTSSLALIIGPMAAAPLYFWLGPGCALVANALSFLASYGAIALVRLERSATSVHRAPRAYRVELAEGLRYFAGNQTLRVIVITACLVMLGGGCLNALDIFFLTQNLHVSADMYGLLSGVAGAGLLVGALLAAALAQRVGLCRTLWMGILSAGLLILLYARLTSLAPALLVIFLIGVPNAALNVAIGPLVLRNTPPQLVGRVAGVLHPAVALASLLSAAVAGFLAGTVLHDVHFTLLGIHWGTIDLIFSWTGLIIVAGGLYARARLHEPA